MPFPIAAMMVIASAPAATAGEAATVYALTAIGVIGSFAQAFYPWSDKDVLPTFHATAEEVTQPVHADAGALVTAASELLNREDQQSQEVNVRADTVLTSAEGHTRSLAEILLAVSSQETPNREAVHAVTVDLEQQQLDMTGMQETLGHVQERQEARREYQALLVENHQLRSTNEALEGAVSELTSSMEEALSLAEALQAENDVLRNQSQPADENRQNVNTHFSVSIFRP